MTPTKFTRYLPARKNVLETLGLRRSPLVPLAGFALFGTGLLIGSALALLLTPRSGPDLRHDLKDRIDNVRNRVRSSRPDGVDRESATA